MVCVFGVARVGLSIKFENALFLIISIKINK